MSELTPLELNNLKTQLKLHNDIRQADNMVLHDIRNHAGQLFSEMIEDRMFIKEKQTSVKFTVEEFNKLRVFLAQLTHKTNGLDQMSSMMKMYLEEKNEKQKLLYLLEE